MDKHLLVVWDVDVIEEFGGDPNLYEALTNETVPYLIARSPQPRNPVSATTLAARFEEYLAGFAAFLTSAVCSANIRVIVCSEVERSAILLYAKQGLVYFPPYPMDIEEVEDWIIRGFLLNRQARQQADLEETLALLESCNGVKSEADIGHLWQMTAEHFEHTLIRWGKYLGSTASGEVGEKAAA